MEEITRCQDLRDELQKELQTIKQQIIDTDDPELEQTYKDILESKEVEHRKLMVHLYQLKDEFKKKKLQNITKNRRKNALSANKEMMSIAHNDACKTAYNCIVIDPEEIALLFNVEYNQGQCVRPSKFVYKWFHDVSTRENNIIPLSPGVAIPQKYCEKRKKVIPVCFYFSYFFNDQEFLQKCTEYYHSFGIDFSLKKDNSPKKNRYWIELKLKDSGMIFF